MKQTKKELEVDFIGGQEPLTAAEEKLLNEYFSKKNKIEQTNTRKGWVTASKRMAKNGEDKLLIPDVFED
jgi:hypothetical protein